MTILCHNHKVAVVPLFYGSIAFQRIGRFESDDTVLEGKTLNPASFPNVAISFIGSPFFVSSYHNLHGTQRRFCRSKYFLAHQQIPHPLSLHVPRTKTQPGRYRNLAGLVLYSLSIAFQSIFAVRLQYADTVLPSVCHRKFSLASSVFHNMRHQPQIPLYQNVPCF